MKRVILASLFLAGTCCVCAADELLKNPGFESGDFSGWDVKGNGWSVSDRSPSEGLRCAVCTVKTGDGRGVRVCLQKIGSVQSGRIVEVSLDVAAAGVAESPNSKASVVVLCAGANKEYRASVVRPGAKFQQIKIDDAVVLPGTSDIYVMLLVEVYQVATDDDVWRFDHVDVRIK